MTAKRHLKHWLPMPMPSPTSIQHIAIVGAGIAGATLANKLAQQGCRIEVFEAAPSPATAASGNLAGNCLPIIDQRPNNPYAQWHWQAWKTAEHWWRQQPNRAALGNLTGAAKWSLNPKTQAAWRVWASQHPSTEVMWCEHLPQPPQQAGLWFPQGGHLIPRAVVSTLLDHPNIQLHTQTHVNALVRTQQQWQLHSNNQHYLADAVIIATGADTEHLLPEWGQTLQRNKGQVSHLPSTAWRTPLQHAISYGGYATPAVDGITCIGATFEQTDPLGLTTSGHKHNMALLAQAYPNAIAQDCLPNAGHSAYRANTLDHLPLVGPVVDISTYQAAIAPYCQHPDTIPNLSHLLQPNLWMSIGHGAHGLTSAFLAAELISQQLLQQPTSIAPALTWAVHPARTIFRTQCHKKSAT